MTDLDRMVRDPGFARQVQAIAGTRLTLHDVSSVLLAAVAALRGADWAPDPDPTTHFLFTATGPAGDRFEWPAIDHHTAEAVWTLLGRPHHAEIVGQVRRHGEAS